MTNRLRIVAFALGGVFLVNGLGWLFRPATAAEGLGLALPDGMARSTMIGDVGAFFLGVSTLILLGAVTCRAHWFQGAALFFALAAVMRTLAWAVHGAAFAGAFIGIEVVVAVALLYLASRSE